MAYTIVASPKPNTVVTYSYLTQIANDMNIFSVHDHSGSLGEGSATIVSPCSTGISASLLYRDELFGTGMNTFGGNGQGFVYIKQLYVYNTCLLRKISDAVYIQPASWMPTNSEWGVGQAAPSLFPVAGGGFRTTHYLRPGTYVVDVYFMAAPSHGVMTVETAGSVVIMEADTYTATTPSLLGKATGSFYNAGSTPVYIDWFISTSINPASTGCFLRIATFSFRWQGS